jgi:hypothetical protein
MQYFRFWYYVPRKILQLCLGVNNMPDLRFHVSVFFQGPYRPRKAKRALLAEVCGRGHPLVPVLRNSISAENNFAQIFWTDICQKTDMIFI